MPRPLSNWLLNGELHRRPEQIDSVNPYFNFLLSIGHLQILKCL